MQEVEMKKVGIIMGSDSDLPVVEKAFGVLREYGIPFEAHVMSAHRTPATVREFVSSARENGFGVIIACAGMAAHLAGVCASYTTLPVIGVTIKGADAYGNSCCNCRYERRRKCRSSRLRNTCGFR